VSETRQRDYLRQVLALDPRSEAEVIMRWRREFLQPTDVLTAELADEDPDNRQAAEQSFQTRILKQLGDLRQDFWTLDDDQLVGRLSTLRAVPHLETAAATKRLQQVSSQRAAIRELQADPAVHPAFVTALATILVAPQAEANRLRDRELSWMRPEQNEHYEASRRAIQGTVSVIQSRYPQLFNLEEGWLTEVLEYDPTDETENEPAASLFGFLILFGFGVTVYVLIKCVLWIFS